MPSTTRSPPPPGQLKGAALRAFIWLSLGNAVRAVAKIAVLAARPWIAALFRMEGLAPVLRLVPKSATAGPLAGAAAEGAGRAEHAGRGLHRPAFQCPQQLDELPSPAVKRAVVVDVSHAMSTRTAIRRTPRADTSWRYPPAPAEVRPSARSPACGAPCRSEMRGYW